MKQVDTNCCIAGGGPAGMMLGLLLARAGVDVVVLEKHKDFLRDFRGDTIHPSTMDILDELGLLDEFLQMKHSTLSRLNIATERGELKGPNFEHLNSKCKYIAMIPQWDFLNFISKHAQQYPNFKLLMDTEVNDLCEEEGGVSGVIASHGSEQIQINAALVIGCDGRGSTVREKAGMKVRDFGVPIDVLWFRLPLPTEEIKEQLFHLRDGQMMITIDRSEYIQGALLIEKNSIQKIREAGINAFQQRITQIVPALRDSMLTISEWDQVKLLCVQINRLENWYRPGVLCIGDAAHAMSPAGGVGINLAIQDAVATANLLADKLCDHCVTVDDLAKVQARRMLPTKIIQRIQVNLHKHMLTGTPPSTISRLLLRPILRCLLLFGRPVLSRLAARIVGQGIRSEHVSQGIINGRNAAVKINGQTTSPVLTMLVPGNESVMAADTSTVF